MHQAPDAPQSRQLLGRPDVDQHRHQAEPPRYVIRPVASLDELAATFDVVGAQLVPALTHEDRRFADPARRFPDDGALMLLVEEVDARRGAGRIVGGALAFGERGITLRAIGLEPRVRGQGLGRRLMEQVELAAIGRSASAISLGASEESKGFYVRLGYAGRGTTMHKALPLPGRFLEARLRRLAGAGAEPVMVDARPAGPTSALGRAGRAARSRQPW